MNPSIVIAVCSPAITLFIAWLIRRDSATRGEGIQAARMDEIERRLTAMESDRVSLRDFQQLSQRLADMFQALSQRLDDIRADLKELRQTPLHSGYSQDAR